MERRGVTSRLSWRVRAAVILESIFHTRTRTRDRFPPHLKRVEHASLCGSWIGRQIETSEKLRRFFSRHRSQKEAFSLKKTQLPERAETRGAVLGRVYEVGFVEQDHVSALDLLHQKVHHLPLKIRRGLRLGETSPRRPNDVSDALVRVPHQPTPSKAQIGQRRRLEFESRDLPPNDGIIFWGNSRVEFCNTEWSRDGVSRRWTNGA